MKKILYPLTPEKIIETYKDLSPLLLQLLYNRGVQTKEEIAEFLYASGFGDPYQIPDMTACVNRIAKAKENGEKIVIHGDYDVDGVCSSAIMYLYLKHSLHIDNIGVYIPSRHSEGYGLSKATIDKFIKEEVSLLITVDCGIKDVDLVAYAKKNGIDVIVTDHHTPGEELPRASAIIHPMFYACKNLCGAGVAFKVVQALDQKFALHDADGYLDLAALGTVCDIMELKGENRVIVKKGLEMMRMNQRIGLEELFTLSGIEKALLDTYHVGYIIGPRLNASGRLVSAYESLKLLITRDPKTAKEAALTLVDLNKQRQEETARALTLSLSYIDDKDFIHVIYIPDISIGVIGLIAGKVKEMTGKAAIIFSDDSQDGVLAGSARSIDALDIIATLDVFAPSFISHGGHKKAAGVKIKKNGFEKFQKNLKEYVKEKLNGVVLEKEIHVDMELDLSVQDLSQVFKEIALLAPFGEGNPRPVFSSDVQVIGVKHIGENGKHLKLQVKDPGMTLARPIEVIGFHMGDLDIQAGEIIDIVYNVGKNSWNGNEHIQLQLIDII